MLRIALALCLLAAATSAVAQPSRANPKPSPAAMQLFERDWVLMTWALKYYDANQDILLQPSEAAAAADAFRKLADRDGDGRITPEEYRSARASILAHD